MSLFGVRTFTKFVRGLTAVTIVGQWGSHVAKVGGKAFALIGEDGDHITFKVTETSFEGLTLLDGIGQAPYFAKRQWVSVSKGAELTEAELKAYITASYRMIAGKLTKKARAELGLTEL
jgi:predicted DNA-binding protein (MmcQ/YjbR family)